ncbi:uncharacterized protein TNCV_3360291 [Trichonephila clavipes]|nr:uncharacterized protein TNCV_3360291 [Trichonephila clavipes]
MSYSGFEPKPPRLQVEGHNHHTGWGNFRLLDAVGVVGFGELSDVQGRSYHRINGMGPPNYKGSNISTNPLVRLVEGEERWEVPDHPQSVLPQNWGETELNHSVTCMVLKATANDRHHLALCQDEFRGPRSETSRQVALSTTNLNPTDGNKNILRFEGISLSSSRGSAIAPEVESRDPTGVGGVEFEFCK